MKTPVASALLFILLAVPVQAQAAGDAEKGEKVFNKCKACHMVGEGAKNRVGPPLNDIIGARAAAVEGFKYSPAMIKQAEGGLVWSPENLDAYLKDPKAAVPDGKMAFPGLKKDEERADVIAYLQKYTKPKQ